MNLKRFFNNPLLFLLIAFLAIEPLSRLLRGGPGAMISWLMDEILLLPAIIIALSFHEYAHARAAVFCGDETPRLQGRLTINPAAHIDPMGFIALLFIRFGWGRPVEINTRNFKNPRRDEIIVGLAGVSMNLLLALIFGGILKAISVAAPGWLYEGFGNTVGYVLMQVVWINLVLMLFNLMPIPPLDGFNVAAQLFRFRYKPIYYTVYEHGMLILMAVIVFNIPGRILTRPLIGLCSLIMSGLYGIPGWFYFM